VLGIWDDHDYGVNDGNRLYPYKQESQALFLDFMGFPQNHHIREREGIYQSYTYGEPGQQLKLIMLDTRYFQDPLSRTPKGSKRNYEADLDGQLLGEAQWRWLNAELSGSEADIHLIVSSLQVIAQDHRYEMWDNFPNERKKLFDLLLEKKIKNPVFLSGDRHLSEVSRINWQGQLIHDITASGMTHSFSGTEEFNQHRVGRLITDENFATLTVDWELREMSVKHFSTSGELYQAFTIPILAE